MATAITPLTDLEAVNAMLATIGESPVTSLLDTGLADVALAKSILSEVTRRLQTRGWYWNTEIEFPLSPDAGTGNVNIPSNALRVDASGRTAYKYDLVARGSRLYDRKLQTYVFTETLYVDMTIYLEFSEIPETARHYVLVAASRVFQARAIGSSTLGGFSEQDEYRALVDLMSENAEVADYNMLTSNRTAMEVVNR